MIEEPTSVPGPDLSETPSYGLIHNVAFLERVRQAVKRRISDLPDHADKESAFRLLCERQGAHTLLQVGREIWADAQHPVTIALTRSRQPHGVLQQWMRLEKFSHTQNRTRLVARVAHGEDTLLTLEHHAQNGGAVAPESHLFVWGVLLGLFELAGIAPDQIRTVDSKDILFSDGKVVALSNIPPGAAIVEFHSSKGARSEPRLIPPPGIHRMPALAREFIARDISHSWTLGEIAQHLNASRRSVQRAFMMERTTFRELVADARLEHARHLLEESRMTMTEIAFCCGFSDQAHFTRLARQRWMLSPTQLRSLLAR